MAEVGYNPLDKLQQAFLSALRLGETGTASNAATEGVGGTDLSAVIASGNVDQYGFPHWAGWGNSHAAGTYQFQPGTWDAVAAEHNLIFSHPEDQAAAAWYYAQQTDPTLYDDLRNKNFSAIQSALRNAWPSVTGNAAAPEGLANNLSDSLGSSSNGMGWGIDWFGNGSVYTGDPALAPKAKPGTTPATGNGIDPSSRLGQALPALQGLFTQGALIVIGAVVIFVALWMLLSSQGAVPGPKAVAKGLLPQGA